MSCENEHYWREIATRGNQNIKDHFVFPSLSDPADVVTVLLPDPVSHIDTYFLQDSSSNIICYDKILGVTRRAHPAKWAKAQRENVPVKRESQFT